MVLCSEIVPFGSPLSNPSSKLDPLDKSKCIISAKNMFPVGWHVRARIFRFRHGIRREITKRRQKNWKTEIIHPTQPTIFEHFLSIENLPKIYQTFDGLEMLLDVTIFRWPFHEQKNVWMVSKNIHKHCVLISTVDLNVASAEKKQNIQQKKKTKNVTSTEPIKYNLIFHKTPTPCNFTLIRTLYRFQLL